VRMIVRGRGEIEGMGVERYKERHWGTIERDREGDIVRVRLAMRERKRWYM
jgi:hypothetical protein